MRAAFVAVLFAVGLAACARSTAMSNTEDGRTTVLRVENQGFADMNIFVLAEGATRRRIGTAIGKSNANFPLPDNLIGRGVRALRFVAAPIATPRGEISEEILVTPGDTVVLIIPPL